MAWRRPGDKPFIWTNDGLVYWRISASLGLNELWIKKIGKPLFTHSYTRSTLYCGLVWLCNSHLSHIPQGNLTDFETILWLARKAITKTARHRHDDVIKWKHFRVTGLLCGEFTGHRWIPITMASDAELWFFFNLRPNKRLSKQSWGWWFETPSCSLWRHCNALTQAHLSITLILLRCHSRCNINITPVCRYIHCEAPADNITLRVSLICIQILDTIYEIFTVAVQDVIPVIRWA